MAPSVEIVSSQDTTDPDDFHDDDEGLDGSDHSDEDPVNATAIVNPGEHDVLLGRGGGTNNHNGNIRFRTLVNEHKMRYLACSKVDKPKVAREVVRIWRKMSPPGRFLARKDGSKKGPGSIRSADNVWYEVGDKKAREKASQCLRERTADVMPYIKQLREHQDAITEQGVSMVHKQLQLQQQQQLQESSPIEFQSSLPSSQATLQQASPFEGFLGQHRHAGGGPGFLAPALSSMGPGHHQPQFQLPITAAAFTPNHTGGLNLTTPGTGAQAGMAIPQELMGAGQQHQPMSRLAATCNTPEMYMNQDLYRAASSQGVQNFADPEYHRQLFLLQQQMHLQFLRQQRLQLQQQEQLLLQHEQQQMRYAHQNEPITAASVFQDDFGEMFPATQDVLYGMSGSSDVVAPTNTPFGTTTKEKEMPPARSALRNSTTMKTTPRRNSKSKLAAGGADPSVATTDADITTATRALPDSTTTLMENLEGGVFTIEEYRRQLEEYIANSQAQGDKAEDEEECPSDLEDDWEKECEKNIKRDLYKRRGVNRNASGISFMSAKTTKSKDSVISGISAGIFSDSMSTGTKEKSCARSLCSSISLMSELTDLSENIENLGLDDH